MVGTARTPVAIAMDRPLEVRPERRANPPVAATVESAALGIKEPGAAGPTVSTIRTRAAAVAKTEPASWDRTTTQVAMAAPLLSLVQTVAMVLRPPTSVRRMPAVTLLPAVEAVGAVSPEVAAVVAARAAAAAAVCSATKTPEEEAAAAGPEAAGPRLDLAAAVAGHLSVSTPT